MVYQEENKKFKENSNQYKKITYKSQGKVIKIKERNTWCGGIFSNESENYLDLIFEMEYKNDEITGSNISLKNQKEGSEVLKNIFKDYQDNKNLEIIFIQEDLLGIRSFYTWRFKKKQEEIPLRLNLEAVVKVDGINKYKISIENVIGVPLIPASAHDKFVYEQLVN